MINNWKTKGRGARIRVIYNLTSLVHIFKNINPSAQSWYNRKTGLSSIGTLIGTMTSSSKRSPINTGMTKIWKKEEMLLVRSVTQKVLRKLLFGQRCHKFKRWIVET